MKPQPDLSASAKDWNMFFEGDKAELYACFHLFYDDFYRLGLSWYPDSDLVKESIHNFFLELWKIWHQPKAISNKKQYVLTIFRNVCFKTYKASARHLNLPPTEHGDPICELPYEALLIASQTEEQVRIKLHQALGKLSARQKEIIQMRYFEGLPFQQIAHLTSLTERTVYNTLHNALKQLRVLLLRMLILMFLFS